MANQIAKVVRERNRIEYYIMGINETPGKLVLRMLSKKSSEESQKSLLEGFERGRIYRIVEIEQKDKKRQSG